ncbi:MAG: hypothetical protein K6A70_07565 [Erysipelotrichaceae bacterium]|nr:hypothetical protein [Erysipelotrichaceae bacterium]
MEYFVLVDTLERESGVQVFKSKKDARKAMESRYIQYRDDAGRDEGDRCELHYDFAYINDLHGMNLDLSVHAVNI